MASKRINITDARLARIKPPTSGDDYYRDAELTGFGVRVKPTGRTTFIVEANVNILTSLLFLKKKTPDEIKSEDLRRKPEEYPVFMAVAEKVGYDRRGNTLYKRNPDGEEIWEMQETIEKIRIGGTFRPRTLRRRRRILNDDLPVIAEKYREFRAKHPEPGS